MMLRDRHDQFGNENSFQRLSLYPLMDATHVNLQEQNFTWNDQIGLTSC
jgi:hypothetical protein